MEPVKKLLEAVVENLNEVNKAVNLSMMVGTIIEQLIGKSASAISENEEVCSIAFQLSSQLQALKYISDENKAKHAKGHF